MSVFRQPSVLGQTTRRRLVGVTAALSSATVETTAVGAWFVLVAVEARTLSTAMAGLGILFCGSLLRTGVFGVATSDLVDLLRPRRLLTTMVLTGSWIVWLLIAESVGGKRGVAVAGLSLALVLTGQFALERRIFHIDADDDRSASRSVPSPPGVVPAILVALGASALLATTWFTDWSFRTTLFTVEGTSLFVEFPAFYFGVFSFWLCSFIAQQRRLYRTLDP
ncbi:hypothetical protein [Natronobeatus ordinarius]|uniref:hypothetical protein n=1 Tax=Natronobeatus ordinarius TaxID=2963433 RepID=UPI0020CBEEA9|nr:hypothetical protein [Natronobeatus ordinarius]